MIDVPEIYPQNESIYVSDTNIYSLTIKKGSVDFIIKLSVKLQQNIIMIKTVLNYI